MSDKRRIPSFEALDVNSKYLIKRAVHSLLDVLEELNIAGASCREIKGRDIHDFIVRMYVR